jgi:cellulose synthase/poly-beta-1,6-N-acetylglucosamine synthase-like glycosyltransferase
MEDAGGWQGDTLTEDLDLSYRAQLRGWRIVYKPDVIVPAELPVQIDALKRQQFRWAKGSIQTAMKLLGALWRSQQPFWRKVLGTLHLTNYSVHPLMVINVLFLLPVSFSHSPLLHFAPILTLAAVGPPAMYWAAMEARGEAWPLRLRRLAMLMALGTGLSINNTKATFEAVARIPSEFKRTPKFAVTERFTSWQTSSYALPHDPTVWLETALAIYALGLLLYSIASGAWWLIIWVLLYAGGYSYIACLAFAQARQLHKSHASTAHGAASEWATPEQPTLPSERL